MILFFGYLKKLFFNQDKSDFIQDMVLECPNEILFCILAEKDLTVIQLLKLREVNSSWYKRMNEILITPAFWLKRFKHLNYEQILSEIGFLEPRSNQILGISIDLHGDNKEKLPSKLRDKIYQAVITSFTSPFWKIKFKELSDTGQLLPYEEKTFGLAYVHRGINLLMMNPKNNYSLANTFGIYPTRALGGDKQYSSRAVQQNGRCFRYLAPTVQNDFNIAYTAVSNHGDTYRQLPQALRNNVYIAKAAVCNDGLVLQAMPDDFKSNRWIVETAVCQYGWALQYASDELRVNRNVARMAVGNCGNAICYAYRSFPGEAVDLRDDKEIALIAVQQNGLALEHVSERLKHDEQVVRAAIHQNKAAIKFADVCFKNNAVFLQAEKISHSFLIKMLGSVTICVGALTYIWSGLEMAEQIDPFTSTALSIASVVGCGFFAHRMAEHQKAVNTYEQVNNIDLS